jgi:hypothetical protein
MTKPAEFTWSVDSVFDDAGKPWDGQATKVAPGSTAQGFLPGMPIPAEYMNWALNLIAQWVAYQDVHAIQDATLVGDETVTSGTYASVLTSVVATPAARTYYVDAVAYVESVLTTGAGMVAIGYSTDGGSTWTPILELWVGIFTEVEHYVPKVMQASVAFDPAPAGLRFGILALATTGSIKVLADTTNLRVTTGTT